MGDSYSNNQTGGGDFHNQRQTSRNNFRGGRGPSNREGGFRIRLSDNEMRAARSLQEAFNLRSTVAVLGFAIRTLAQMLEDGSLDNLVNEYRSQVPSSEYRRGKENNGSFRNEDSNAINTKPNPFARPERPVKDDEVSNSDKSEDIAQVPEENNNVKETEDRSNEGKSTKTSEQV